MGIFNANPYLNDEGNPIDVYALEQLLRYVYGQYKLNLPCSNYPHQFQFFLIRPRCIEDSSLLLTESLWCPKEQREKAVEAIFETFELKRLQFSVPGVLSCYASGRTDGIVVDCGEKACSAIAVYEGIVGCLWLLLLL